MHLIFSLKENSCDYYTISFGLRNTKSLNKSLSEAYRVLKPGGFLLTLDYFSKENQPAELVKDISNIIGLDVSKTTLEYWINLHTSQPFNIEGIETKKPYMHAMPIKTKIKNIRTVLGHQNHTFQEQDLEVFESHLEVFQNE